MRRPDHYEERAVSSASPPGLIPIAGSVKGADVRPGSIIGRPRAMNTSHEAVGSGGVADAKSQPPLNCSIQPSMAPAVCSGEWKPNGAFSRLK
jgi:hypothetical protein